MNSTSCSSQKGYESEAILLQLSSAVLQRFVVLSDNLLFSNYFHFKATSVTYNTELECCLRLFYLINSFRPIFYYIKFFVLPIQSVSE